jgi:putative ATPase
MKELGYAKGYKYAHDYDGNFTAENFLPEAIQNTIIYRPQENQREIEIRKRLAAIWKDKYNY